MVDYKPVDLEIDFRRLDLKDFDEASESEINKSWFSDKKMERIKSVINLLNQNSYGYFEGGELACYGWINSNIANNKVGDFTFSEYDAFLWDGYTSPVFRGKGLHDASILYRLNKAKEMGKKYVWSDVYPYNMASARNYVKQGFEPVFEFQGIKLKNGKIYKRIKILNQKLYNNLLKRN